VGTVAVVPDALLRVDITGSRNRLPARPRGRSNGPLLRGRGR
jgi:hypothetical protein